MKHVKKTKLWQGKIISLRDYEVDEAIKAGGLALEHDGQIRVLTPSDLKELLFQCHGQDFKSKIEGWKNPLNGGDTYKLVDIDWTKLDADEYYCEVCKKLVEWCEHWKDK